MKTKNVLLKNILLFVVLPLLILLISIFFFGLSISHLLNATLLILIFAILTIFAIIGYFSVKKPEKNDGETPKIEKTWWQKRHASTFSIIGSVCTIFLVILILAPDWFTKTITIAPFIALIIWLILRYIIFPMKETKPIKLFNFITGAGIVLLILLIFLWSKIRPSNRITTHSKKIGKEWVKLPRTPEKGTSYIFTIQDSSAEIFIARSNSGLKQETTEYFGETEDGLARRFGYKLETDNPTKTPVYICVKSTNKKKIGVEIIVGKDYETGFTDLARQKKDQPEQKTYIIRPGGQILWQKELTDSTKMYDSGICLDMGSGVFIENTGDCPVEAFWADFSNDICPGQNLAFNFCKNRPGSTLKFKLLGDGVAKIAIKS